MPSKNMDFAYTFINHKIFNINPKEFLYLI